MNWFIIINKIKATYTACKEKYHQSRVKIIMEGFKNISGANILAFILILITWIIGTNQIGISRDTAKKQLRAYLVVEKPTLGYPHPPEIGRRLEMTFTLRNDGQTPAYDVRDSIYLEIRTKDCRPIKMPIGTRDFNHPIYGSGVPHRRTAHSGKQIVEQKHVDGFNNRPRSKDYRIFFWGRVEYTDIYQRSHWTNFCYEYIFEWDEFRPYGKCHNGDREKPYKPFWDFW